jgi:two-component system cell cycle sensor histidine kinase/response regulator CckA
MRQRKAVLEYYVDVIRTISTSVNNYLDIIALNRNGEVIYTTRPDLYPTKQAISIALAEKVISIPELQSFLEMIDAKTNWETLLCGEGTGLQNHFKKWIATCSFIGKSESLLGDEVSVITITDVSKHLDQFDKISRNYSKLETFLDNFPVGIFYINNNGIIIGANLTFANMVNVSRERLLGCSIQDFIEDFKADEVGKENPNVVKFKPKYTTRFNAILIKSSFSATSSSLPWLTLKIDKLLPTIKETSFLEQEAFVYSPVPSIVATATGEIKAINSEFATMVQDKVILGKDDFVKSGKNITEFTHDSTDAKSIINHLQQALTSREKTPPIEIKFSDGNVVTTAYLSRVGKYSIKPNNYNDLLLIQFFDISSQKVLEQQFIQSQKMQSIGQLAGGIAHDFNNLLTAMIGFCDLLLQRYTQSDPSYGDVIQIRQNAKRAANLVRQLLAFSRQQTLKPRVVSVTEILAELSALLKRLIGADIEFQIMHGRDIWHIKVDYSQFEQVIINLCVNARDAIHRNGKLTIRTRNFFAEKPFKCVYDVAHPGDYVMIEVIDNGIGIDPNIIESIFEPFFTRKSTECRNFSGSGTGLGLSTVYGIINQTGGFIKVESELGKGSTFQILIPRYIGNEPLHDSHANQNVKDLSGTDTIMLVEDEDAVRMFSARALREKGYKVFEADCGEEALRIAATEKFDLLITDVVMPKMDGPTLSKKLCGMFNNLQTIFISGYTEDTFRQDLDKDSNIHFLQKPFTLKDLASKVKEVILSDNKQNL